MSGSTNKDMALLGRLLRELSGECRVCGCHGDSCDVGMGEKCVWLDSLRTLCNHPHCVAVAAPRSRQRRKRRRAA